MPDKPFLISMEPYLRQQHSFTMADKFGSTVVHQDLIEQALFYKAVAGVACLNDGSFDSSYRRTYADHLISNIDPSRLDETVGSGDTIFLTRLSKISSALQLRIPLGTQNSCVCALLHSAMWPDLLSTCTMMLTHCRPFDAIVATSRSGAEAITCALEQVCNLLSGEFGISLRRRVTELPIKVIPLGIDSERFMSGNRLDCRRLIGIPENEFVMAYVGRLSPKYKADLEPLFQCLHRLRQDGIAAHLLIAGQDISGRYREVYQNYAIDCGIARHCTIITDFAYYTKPMFYRAANVFVSPVDNIQETFGLSVIEAMASGIPVVVSDWSGYRDTVEHDVTGFRVPTLWNADIGPQMELWSPVSFNREVEYLAAKSSIINIQKMYEYLYILSTNSELCLRMGEKGVERVTNQYSWQRVIKQFESLWCEMTALRRRAPICQYNQGWFFDYNRIFSRYASNQLCGETKLCRGSVCEELSADRVKADPQLQQLLDRILSSFTDDSSRRVMDVICISNENERQAITWLMKKGYLYEVFDEKSLIP